MCVFGSVDYQVDTKDCACFLVRDHEPGYMMPGALKQLGGQQLFRGVGGGGSMLDLASYLQLKVVYCHTRVVMIYLN